MPGNFFLASTEHRPTANADIALHPLSESRIVKIQRGELEQMSDAERDAVSVLAFSEIETATKSNDL